MKKHLYRFLCCTLLFLTAAINGNAANGIIKTIHYNQCFGDTISFDNGVTKIYRDTIIRDTIQWTDPFEDSIYVHVVNFYPLYRFTEQREMKLGQTLEWRGQTITGSGVYEQVLKSSFGCDSTFILTVSEKRDSTAFYTIKDTTICEGNYVTWEGHIYTSSTTESKTLKATDGRDSILILRLTVRPSYHFTETMEFAKFPATYKGVTFTAPGEKQDIVFKSSTGCDSTITVWANQKPLEEHEYITICAGSNCEWRGKSYDETGIYQEETIVEGVKMTHVLHLTVKQIAYSYVNASICEGDFFMLNGRRYTKQGTYRDTFLVDGCDSIVILSLNTAGRDTSYTTHQLMPGESFTWNGNSYNTAGTYQRILTNILGCDSVAYLVLTVDQVDTISYTASICPGDSIIWHGLIGRASKQYSRLDTMPNGDVVLYQLNLTVRPLKEINKYFSICPGSSVTFNGETYSESGTYDNYLTCDTLCHVIITRKPEQIYETHATYNGTGNYSWNVAGTTLTISNAGLHEHLVPNPSTGCDDIYRLILTVDSNDYHFEEYETVCQDEPFVWHGLTNLSSQHIGETFDYTAKYKTKANKDSIYVLHLTVNPKFESSETVNFLSFPVEYRHQTISGPGVYYDSLKTVGGCDSIITIHVIQQTLVQEETATICDGEKYHWRGKDYTLPGQYNETEKTYNGRFDSVYHRLILDVNYPVETFIYDTICQGGNIQFGGKTISTRGVYRDTLKGVNQCDSVVVLTLNVMDVYTRTEVYQRPLGSKFTWPVTGKEYTAPHTTDTVFVNRFGCDSIVRMVLTALTVDTVDNEATICSGDYYEWHGKRYYGENKPRTEYTNVDTLMDGKLVFYRLHLNVEGLIKDTVDTLFTICQGETVSFNGTVYAKPGKYFNNYSCDTVFRITIVQNLPNVYVTELSGNGRDSVHWKYSVGNIAHDTAFLEPGTYEVYDFNTQTGCRDIYRLILTVDSSSYHFLHRASICYGEDYTLSVYGKTYSGLAPGTYDYYKKMKTSVGLDSIYHLELTVHRTYHSYESVEFSSFPARYRDSLLTSPGQYDFHYIASGGCDSIISVTANKRIVRDETIMTICAGEYFDWLGERYSETTNKIIIEKTKDGNSDSIYHHLDLTVINIPVTYVNATICRGNSYTFGGVSYTEGGKYTHTFKRYGCDSTVVLSLAVVDVDTTIIMHRLEEGKTYHWDVTNRDYDKPGAYDTLLTNSHGCDSIVRLIITHHRVDTVRKEVTICPDSTFVWHGILGKDEHVYTNVEQQPDGTNTVYILTIHVKEAVEDTIHLSICAGESVSYKNSPTFDKPGSYTYQYTCDTLYNIIVTQRASEVHETEVTLNGQGSTYTWHHPQEDGTWIDEPISQPGTYNRYIKNSESGCNDIYRLIVTKNKTNYHFVETRSICEGEDFSWRNKGNQLSHQHIGETFSYFDSLTTINGNDSIYELKLTVVPAVRTEKVIYFCGSTKWKGQTHTESFVAYDTLASATSCDSIVTMRFNKAASFFSHDTITLVQGEQYQWHGQTIVTSGLYRDAKQNQFGCDSIYELGVGLIAATPHSNTYSYTWEMCEGDYYIWRGDTLYTSNTYVDSVDSRPGIPNSDSIFVLHLTVWPTYKDTIVRHMYTCGENASIRYQGIEYFKDTMIIRSLPTIHGCDSIVKTYLHFNTALFLSDTVKIADTELPYTWHFRLADIKMDSVVTKAGTYTHKTPAEGTCMNQEQLVLIVYPTYLYEQDTTICELDKPFYWLNGPQDHIGDQLWHTVGTEKQYEYRYTTVNNTDSIYRLNLTIDPAPKKTEQYTVCEGYPQWIRGKQYGKPGDKLDSLYRDTIYPHSPGTICDSIVYVEVYVSASKQSTKVVVLHDNESISWGKYTNITSAGIYRDTAQTGPYGCDSIATLRVIKERIEQRVICSNDTAPFTHPDKKYPYVWNHPYQNAKPDTLYTSGIYRDTTFDQDGYIQNLYRLDLTIVEPFDTTVIVHGCQNKGAIWRDRKYENDTSFVDRIETTVDVQNQPCDSVFHVIIKIDTTYKITIDTTICEYQLPFIVGRINPDTIWQEGDFRHALDSTSCGCDSIIEGHLTIKPKLTHNDSTFICEDDIKQNPIWLGDTIHPAFENNDGGKWRDKWQGKWHGVKFTSDTIVWDCSHQYFHHIIVRPSQKLVIDTNFYLCPGDSLRLFWGRGDDTTWFYKDTLYEEHTPMPSTWIDKHHHYSYANDAYSCDSITRWHITVLPRFHKDTTAHKLLGDSIWWGGAWRYYTGTYDSIAPAPDTSSLGDTCTYTYPLHLIVDTAYYFRDTVDFCAEANTTYSHIWPETNYKQDFTVGDKDSIAHHFIDSLTTYDRRDSIYDLCVNYRIIKHTIIYDTICEGDSLRFDIHHRNNTITERYLDTDGTYRDTLTATSNGCDSIVTLYFKVRHRIPATHKTDFITDRELPYVWSHTWKKADGTDTTYVERLYTTVRENDFGFLMPSVHGCDSVDSLHLTVHKTHVYRDTIDVCAPLNQTREYTWTTGYVQTFSTPLADDTSFYGDTLDTRIKYDSIYVLCVNFHQTYEQIIRDTICEGERYRFDIHRGNNTIERWLDQACTVSDTLESTFGCDSVITLKLFVRDRMPIGHNTVHIPDTMAPYLWTHKWRESDGTMRDSTRVLTASGDYEFRTHTKFGCDSIDSLSLFIHPTYYIVEPTITICERETPYTWQNRNDITKSDTYRFDTLTVDGYDSIHSVYIKVLPTVYDTIRLAICEGDSLRFGLKPDGSPRFVSRDRSYDDTTISVRFGCDSITTLYLSIHPKHYTHNIVHIPDTAAPFAWHHIWTNDTGTVDSTRFLNATGNYGIRMQSQFGCDSIDSLSLFIHPTYYIVEPTITICERETPYTWHNRNDITESGTYRFDTLTVDGYDSIYIANIIVNPIVRTTISVSKCENELPFIWNGQTLTTDGQYVDSLITSTGCDSVVTLNFTVTSPYYHLIKEDILQGQYYVFYGDTIRETKTINHSARTPAGCDSTTVLQLTVHPLVDTVVTICDKELPYLWKNRWTNKTETYHNSGVYRNDTTINGEKFFYGMQLVIKPLVYDTVRHTMCDGTGYTFNGKHHTKAGIYRDTLVAANGCDRIVTTILTTLPKNGSHRVAEILDVDTPYVWEHIQWNCGIGHLIQENLYASGEYSYRMENQYGCDSIDSLTLIIHKTYKFTEEITICERETPYTWHDRNDITQSGTYYYNPLTTTGHDSVFIATITVVPTKRQTITVAKCENELPFIWHGQTLTTGGQYVDSLISSTGCDSIVTLNFTVNNPYYHLIQEDILQGHYYVFFGDTIRETTTINHSSRTPSGCDSTTVLQLTVHPLVDTIVTICEKQLPYIWHNKWNGQTEKYYNAGIYRNDTAIGTKKFFYGLQIIVNQPTDTTIYGEICEGDAYHFGIEELKTPGKYTRTLTNKAGCDSIVTLILNVNLPYYEVLNRTIYQGDTLNIDGEKYFATGNYLLVNDHTRAGCDSIKELRLTVVRLYDDSVNVCHNDLPYRWPLMSDPTKTMEIYNPGIYRDTVIQTDGQKEIHGIFVNVLPIAVAKQPRFDTICQGDVYTFGSKARQLTEGGIYYDTIASSNGCDSIDILNLYVQPVIYQSEIKSIFEGDSVWFQDNTFKKKADIYNYREPVANGKCFNTYQLVLKVIKPVDLDTTASVCENKLPFMWRGHEYNASGDYTLPISWNDTSRITMTLHLTVTQAPMLERIIDLCAGDTFIYKGKAYCENGEFKDTIPSITGCDSIIRHIVRVHPTYDRTFEKHISDKEPFIWHERPLSLTGIYEWTGKTSKYQCDSTEHLNLIVHPSFFQSDTIDLCQSDTVNYPYVWRDENGRTIATISQSGVYNDSVLTAYGFDSVHQLVVKVHPSYMINEQYEIGEGEVLKLHGRDISKPAIYFDTLRTIHGCDSVFHVVINQKRTREFTWDRTICQSDPKEYPYNFFGRQLTHTGQYKYTSTYKDSIVTLNLTVNPISISETRVVITSVQAKNGYIFNGKLYTDLPQDEGKKVFSDTLNNQYGCDSIIRLAIVVTKRYSEWIPIPLCPGSEVKIDGQVITKAGLYTFERRSRVTGEMDSLYRVEVYDSPAYDLPVERKVICEGDTVKFGGKAITRGGRYDFTLKTKDGCDSIIHLDLTVNPSYHFYTFASTPDYKAYEWLGKSYTLSGVYDRTWPTSHDCDSTYTLDLTVVETKRDTVTETICTGQTFSWRGKEYNADGYYTDTVWQPEANFSAIYALRLIVAYPSYITSARTGEICADGESFDIFFEYSGHKPTHYSVYFDQHAKREGFQDVIDEPFSADMIAHVKLPQFQAIAYQGHPYYIRPDYYSMRIALDNGVCGINRSDSLTLLVRYPSWILEQNWDDVVAPLKAEYNGGYEFSHTDWYLNGALISSNTGYLQSKDLQEGDKVVMVATRKGESVSIPSCPLIIQASGSTVYDTPVIVYPTQTPKQMPTVTIEAPKNGKYEVYSSTGLLIGSGQLTEGKTSVTLPSINGIYFIRTHQGNEVTAHKVILY